MPHSVRERRLLGGILAVFVALSVVYNVLLPLFEAPDEADHYRFARWLASGQAYPNLGIDAGAAGHEIWQTPLYYYAISPLVSWARGGEPHETAPLNPGYQAGYSSVVHVHTFAEVFPYAGTALAVHLARSLTALFGVGVILATYGLAKSMWPPAALIAAGLVAFNPQFVFMSSVINNDVPAACLAALTVWWLFRGFRQPARSRKWALVTGSLWGLAILTKLNNAILVVPIGLGLLAFNWPLRQSWKRVLIESVFIAMPVLLLTGWWFALNQARYQDWLAWQPMLNTVQGLQRPQPLNWDQTLTYSAGLLTTFWLIIGYGFRGPDGFYVFFNVLLFAAVLGLCWWIWAQLRQRSRRALLQVGILGAWVIASFISLLQWMRLLHATDQGRLLFPVLSGLAALLAIGLTRLAWRRFSLAPIALGGLLICAVATPWIVMHPAYAQPVALSAEAVLPNARAIQFGDDLGLRGFQLTPDRLNTPGELAIDLYWTSIKPPTADYIARVTLVNRAGGTPAVIDSMPFAGRYPTSIWQPAEMVHERVRMPVPAVAQPQLATVYLSLYPIGRGRDLIEAVENGAALGRYIELGPVKLRGSTASAPPRERTAARLGDEVELTGFEASAAVGAIQPVTLTLHWHAAHRPVDDYTVFIHLLGPDGSVVGQADSQPHLGQYPTSYWDEGEQVLDSYEVSLPADLPTGDYRLLVGMYRLATGERLTARQANGEAWPDNAILLKTYHVP